MSQRFGLAWFCLLLLVEPRCIRESRAESEMRYIYPAPIIDQGGGDEDPHSTPRASLVIVCPTFPPPDRYLPLSSILFAKKTRCLARVSKTQISTIWGEKKYSRETTTYVKADSRPKENFARIKRHAKATTFRLYLLPSLPSHLPILLADPLHF